jgi:hypothetical protein
MKGKNHRRQFFHFIINRHGREITEIAHHINAVWMDIEYLRYIYDMADQKFNDTKDNDECFMLFDALHVVSMDFYVHLEIIRKMIGKLLHVSRNPIAKDLYTKHKDLWNRIGEVRNSVIIHRDKPNFYKRNRSSIANGFRGIDFELEYEDKDGNKSTKLISGLGDVSKVEQFLKEIMTIFNQGGMGTEVT